jgi:isoleucyl-tRNA synthetase
MTDYKDTLNLPRTDFEMRAGLATKEPRILARWQKDDLYGAIRAARAGKPRFVLHDGPPYANGLLHNGHILNKILKDIVIKDRTMAGHDAPYIPGWDCHGLPIEVQVDKELGAKKADMSRADIRGACRAYAGKFVDAQRDGFRRLGVLGRWDDPYLTMNFAYEAATLRELARFVESGLVYKGLRPVNWCTTHQTALAEAEVEYENHRSPSVYVAFEVVDATAVPGFPAVADLVIWTTTPWTLPANLAIAVHPDLSYVAYPVRGRLRVVARELLPAFLTAVGEPDLDPSRIAGTWEGRALEGVTYQHPFLLRRSRVLLGEHVTVDAGTGCVHTAPGHGPEDFELGRRHGLEILSPVDAKGVLTEAAGPFAGLHILAANPKIVEHLHRSGALLSPPDASIEHRYAHCWRCHKPIMLRATEQWWVAMDKPLAGGATLRERALAALKGVRWVPHWGEDRIHGMLAARPDWCLSRQRTWGVPIAVVYCDKCNTPHVSPEGMRRVADVFAHEGATAWYTRSVAELFGSVVCEACGHGEFRKENDILDVWFDSGVSFAAVVEAEGLGHREGAAVDLYLEGSDQHRGWFHSSLLCSLATRQRPPYRAVLTHGFVVDGQGKKISKSKGNFVDPFKAIDKDGAELLRLWVASEDYRDDIRLSQEILTRLSDNYRKVRNTIRYLLGNIADFDPGQHVVAPSELLEVDRYALSLGARAVGRVRAAYDAYSFHVVMQTLVELCTVDLSAFYLDMLKDRLYASRADSPARRSAQTALYLLARDLLRLMAPVFCFTAEEAWQFLPRFPGDPSSVHLALYPAIEEPTTVTAIGKAVSQQAEALLEKYGQVRDVRRSVNAVLEEARRGKVLGASSEAQVTLRAGGDTLDALRTFGTEAWADMLIVSSVRIEPGGEALAVDVSRASGTKCARCWLYRVEVGKSSAHPALCGRCVEAL